VSKMVWVGGSPCSGKSTVARALATDRGWSLYSCDEAFDRHSAAVSAADGPTLKKVASLSVADRLAQDVDLQVADVVRLCEEEFPLILHDLATFPDGVVVEGAALMPGLLRSIAVPVAQAVWIVPTEQFQNLHYGDRAWARAAVSRLPDPLNAFSRWMQRDARFATRIAQQAGQLGYRVIVVDGSETVEQITAAVTDLMPLA